MSVPVSKRRVVWSVVAFESGLGVVALVLALLWNVPLREQLEGGAATIIVGLVASLPMLLVMMMVAALPWGPVRELVERVRELLVPLFASCTRRDLAVVALAAGVGEELLFRGVLQAAITAQAGPVVGVLVASILFAAGHALTRTYAVLAGLISVYLGVLFLRSGGVIAPIVAHACYDYIALLLLIRNAGSE